jgi:hypothetical protein
MPTLERTLVTGLAALASLLSNTAATAQGRFVLAPTVSVRTATPVEVPAARPFEFFGSKRIDSASLAAQRGGTQVLNDMKLRGVVADNQAINVTTGGNQISDGAFAGAAGIPMVIQNSGNNVLIQSATIVNVQVK